MVRPRSDSEMTSFELGSELHRLLLSPYREIIGKARVVIENATREGDSAPSNMNKIAQRLLTKNEQYWGMINNFSDKYLNQYGSAYVDAINNNDDIAQCRSELEDLLWDFDDYIEVQGFDANRFEELEKVSEKSAYKTIDILKRLKLEPIDGTPHQRRDDEHPTKLAIQGERISMKSSSDLQQDEFREALERAVSTLKPSTLLPSFEKPEGPNATRAGDASNDSIHQAINPGITKNPWYEETATESKDENENTHLNKNHPAGWHRKMKAIGSNAYRKMLDSGRKSEDTERSSASDPGRTFAGRLSQASLNSGAKPQTSLFRPLSLATPMGSDALPSSVGLRGRSDTLAEWAHDEQSEGSRSLKESFDILGLSKFRTREKSYIPERSVLPTAQPVYSDVQSTMTDPMKSLEDIGLSENAMVAIIHCAPFDGPSLFRTHSEWLLYIAERLGYTYPNTRDTSIAEAAVDVFVKGIRTGQSGGQLDWLDDRGPRLTYQDNAINTSISTKTAILEWELPQVFSGHDSDCEGEVIDLRAEIRNFVILSGSDGAFEATTCAQYVEASFGVTGLEVLDAVIDVLVSITGPASQDSAESVHGNPAIQLRSRVCAIKPTRASQSCITLTTQGFDFNPVEMACIKWLCKAVRVVPHSNLSSELGPRLMESTNSQDLCLGGQYNETITAFSLKPLRQLSGSEIGIDGCWVHLFKSAVIAWTPTEYPWSGLRLSYEMLIRLAAVTNYVHIDCSSGGGPNGETTKTTEKTSGGLIALGFFTALIPISYDPVANSTQWHLEVTRDSIIKPEDLKILNDKWLHVRDPKVLMESQCFLGWKGNVQVMLGTEGGCYNLQWTDLPRVERVFRLEGFEIGGEIGIGDILPISLKNTGSLSFKACSTVQSFTASASYEQALRLLSQHVALVYDSRSQIAWLVPQLSWNLHLCHVWYRHINDEEIPHDPIPFASMSADGASAACEALHMQSGLAILEGLNLGQLFLQIYRNMNSSNMYRQKPTKSRVFGPEVMDLIEEPGRGSPLRKLDLPESDQSWQYLVSRADTIGFCKGLGQALTPQDCSLDHTCGCDIVPSNRSLLVAHNMCIERLLKRDSTNLNALQNGTLDLDDGKEWLMRKWPFDTCTHSPGKDYWSAANISMQRIAKPSLWSMKKKAIELKGHCEPIPKTGAFVFGNPLPKETRAWGGNKPTKRVVNAYKSTV